MGRYYTVNEATTAIYVKKEVLLASVAIAQEYAEAYETGTGKLATPDNATAFPAFDNLDVVDVNIVSLGDYDIRLVKDSEAINSGTGGYGFSLFISSVTVEPVDGLYYFNISFHTT